MPSQRELSRPPCTRPKSIRSLPRSIRWVAWEKYRKSWMQYCISTRRVSSLEKFFTSMEDRRPVTTRSKSLRRVIIIVRRRQRQAWREQEARPEFSAVRSLQDRGAQAPGEFARRILGKVAVELAQ